MFHPGVSSALLFPSANGKLAHIGRVVAMGELTAMISHELSQPLSAILTNAQATRRLISSGKVDTAEIDEALSDIAADAARAGELIMRLRRLLRNGDVDQRPLDLNEVVRELEPLARIQSRKYEVEFALDLAARLPQVMGDRVQLQQVMLNLIANGCQAMADRPREYRTLTVQTSCTSTDEIVVAVRDAGSPVSGEVLHRMFEPFYTTRSTGLGIGLCISRSIVEAHGGRLWANRNPERGITMRFSIPCIKGELDERRRRRVRGRR